MAKQEIPHYERICKARKSSLFSRATVSLWKGDDHFLLITSNFFVERYKRFYFRDIQGISLTPRKMWPYRLAALGLMSLLPITPVIYVFTQDVPDAARFGFAITAGVIFLIFFILFLVTLAKGRTCRCCFLTAVQIEEIGAIDRFHVAEKHLPAIQSLVATAQAEAVSDNQPLGGETAST